MSNYRPHPSLGGSGGSGGGSGGSYDDTALKTRIGKTEAKNQSQDDTLAAQKKAVDDLVAAGGVKGDTGAKGDVGPVGPVGPQGETGSQGTQGIQGGKGDTGAKGADGGVGPQGPKGDQGVQGIQGLKGDTGTKGDTGAQGLKGDQGIQGIQGLKGDAGSKGDQGVKGDTGSQGVQGLKGEKGDTGAQGVQGPAGPAGADGVRGLQGVQGARGADGSGLRILGVLTSTAALPVAGQSGEAYVVGEHLHAWTGSSWTDLGSFRGQAGSQGERGLPGDRGVDGAAGSVGPRGADGSNLRILGTVPTVADLPASGQHGDGWTVGTVLHTWSGSAWTAVADLRGPRGPDGLQGVQGVAGPAGVKGDAGARGERGATGNTIVAMPSAGARVYHAAVQQYAVLSTWDTLKWDTVDRDTAGAWSASSPSRLTVPVNATKVRVSAGVAISITNKIGANLFQLRKNGAVVAGLGTMSLDYGSTYTDLGDVLNSGVIAVMPGDYFELFYYSAESFDVVAVQTWFEIEVVEVDGAGTGLSFELIDLADVDVSKPFATGDVPIYDAATKRFKPGVPTVYVSAGPFARRPFKGAMVGISAPKAFTVNPAWDAVEYDTDAFWSAARPSQFRIPTGKNIRLVRLSAAIIPDSAFNGDLQLWPRKNGFRVRGLPSITAAKFSSLQDGGISIVSAPIRVVDDDLLEVQFYNSGSVNAGVISYYAIEVLAYADEVA